MTSGNSPVSTMAFIPRYRALLKRDTVGEGMGGCSVPAAEPVSEWYSSGKSQVPLSTGPVQSALPIQAVIMVTSSGMSSTACIPGLGDFPFPPGSLAVLL